jgi:hypothetical protein
MSASVGVIQYSDINAWNKKDKVPVLCYPSASWNTTALSLLQEKQYYLSQLYFNTDAVIFAYRMVTQQFYQGVSKF